MSNYDSDSITLYEGLEHVRKRPGMYIGGTDQRALHYMVELIIDNAVDMALAGYGKRIEVVLMPNQTVQVIDESGGLRLDLTADGSKTFAEREMTFPSAGSALDPQRPSFWDVGLQSVGMGVTNGLSEWFTLDIRRDGFEWRQRYEHGKPTGPFTMLRTLDEGETYGNTFTFRPDYTIFDSIELEYDLLAARLQEYAYSTPSLLFILKNRRTAPFREHKFFSRNGILDYLHIVRGDVKPLHKAVFVSTQYTLSPAHCNKIQIELALQFTERHETWVECFVNVIRCVDGGSHIRGLQRALKDYSLSDSLPTEITHGMIAIISIRHPCPQFESHVHRRLMNHDVEDEMYKLTLKALEQVEW